jgi:hypothetical protein
LTSDRPDRALRLAAFAGQAGVAEVGAATRWADLIAELRERLPRTALAGEVIEKPSPAEPAAGDAAALRPVEGSLRNGRYQQTFGVKKNRRGPKPSRISASRRKTMFEEGDFALCCRL